MSSFLHFFLLFSFTHRWYFRSKRSLVFLPDLCDDKHRWVFAGNVTIFPNNGRDRETDRKTDSLNPYLIYLPYLPSLYLCLTCWQLQERCSVKTRRGTTKPQKKNKETFQSPMTRGLLKQVNWTGVSLSMFLRANALKGWWWWRRQVLIFFTQNIKTNINKLSCHQQQSNSFLQEQSQGMLKDTHLSLARVAATVVVRSDSQFICTAGLRLQSNSTKIVIETHTWTSHAKKETCDEKGRQDRLWDTHANHVSHAHFCIVKDVLFLSTHE